MWRSLFVLALLLPAGCKARDGETLRQVARKTGQKLGGAARPLEATATLRNPLAEANVAARVDSRLRNDRYLAPYQFTVRGDHGSVTVGATVPEASLKARAPD